MKDQLHYPLHITGLRIAMTLELKIQPLLHQDISNEFEAEFSHFIFSSPHTQLGNYKERFVKSEQKGAKKRLGSVFASQNKLVPSKEKQQHTSSSIPSL